MITLLFRSRLTVAWVVLVAVTGISWSLGTHTFGDKEGLVSVVILGVAVFKARLVGVHFMDLRSAPWLLRGAFEGICAVLLLLLTAMFLAGS